jgi:hypothetical protein
VIAREITQQAGATAVLLLDPVFARILFFYFPPLPLT